MSDHLSLPIRLPDEDADRCERLATLTQRVANHVLKSHWTPSHLDGITDSSHQAWKYFDEHEPFEVLDLYLPSRFRRCILQKVGGTLRSHADRRDAFRSIQTVLPDHKIRRIHRRRIKKQLWGGGEYLTSGYVDILIDQLNSYYDRHGTYPDTYFEMQSCPEYDSGVLPFSADDGPTSGQAVKYQYDSDSETLTIRLKTPDTLNPDTRGDWSWTEYERDGYGAFHDLLSHGDLSAPEFQPSCRKNGDAYYELAFSVEVEHAEATDGTDCILALDAGMRKDMTAVVVTEDGEQLSTPHEIREVVLERGFNEEINSFGRSFESDELLDASALRIPLVGFLPFDDPRVQGTIDAVRERLTTEEGLVHRYEGEDGLPGDEGAFVLCSFWLVDCLALSGEVEEAEQLFENILEYTSPLGLLSEEIVPEAGEPLGNYPQAFSHLGLINSAIYIEAAKNEESTVDIDYPAIDARLE